ncbi:AAA family ATPase [Archangium lipolyticum]|uniref:AAA family ATPase n=1 Tax=Archangium lipolyticum TaxID=2970465 RepID=UPI00214A5B06|nr:MoxR family ATPase [Archangium lipolyticum]
MSSFPVKASTTERAAPVRVLVSRLADNLERVIRGKREALELVLCSVAAGGHVLLEDVPGTGKTTLAKALALSIGGSFKRVQFTPDLLPTDIVGSSIFNPQEGTFRFREGPLFANVLIADEINRASPRTQSALLEALSEGQVTVDGQSHVLAPPFLCIATQNPVEFHGTYPLPEASLDRFAVQLSLGYLPEGEERTLLMTRSGPPPLEGMKPVCTVAEVTELQRQVQEVKLEESVADYLLRIVQATRGHPSIRLGVSTRGALVYGRMARARALMQGRDYVLPEDLKALGVSVLAHRLVLDTRARYAGADKQALTKDLIGSVPVPR